MNKKTIKTKFKVDVKTGSPDSIKLGRSIGVLLLHPYIRRQISSLYISYIVYSNCNMLY